jgi:hypothetical protein
MKRIVWLASYPKSGNTWFRVFLANLLRDPDEPVNINELQTGPIASARGPLDDSLGYDSSNLTHGEIDRLRPEFYSRQAKEGDAPLFLKVHDAYTFLPDGRPLFPPEATEAVLYFIRNPLDVCISYAHHSGRSDCCKTINAMGNPEHVIASKLNRHNDQLRQKMLSWSQHVLSWVEAPGHRVHIMRYEDMKQKTEETFTAAAHFAKLPTEPARIRKAIHFSRFEELSKQEEKAGFRERLHADRKFFRKGQIGSDRESLSAEQIQQLIRDHSQIMKRFGYLGSNGELL